MARRKTGAPTGESLFDEPTVTRTLAEEVESAFLDYSMSVIVSRALPDVRDGLKPVHRRILWAMHDAGLRPDRAFVKCARVVGDVMAYYHPHGDTAIYDALARLGQDFSIPHPLVDKHGNFGSPSDPPAAARYTECRLSALAQEMLAAIDEGTVDFEPTYDASGEEPMVLPSRFPNLLINGGQGIAVGMASNIPPHNLAEVCNAALLLMDKPDATMAELMRKVKGPDFPTGGLIMGDDGIKDAYRTGRGTIRVRAVTHIEESRRGNVIVLTEIPYQTSVDAIAGKLAEAVEAGKIEGIRDIRNESGQGQTRLVVELKPEVNEQVVLNNLYKQTPAETTFGINIVALVDGVPRTLTLTQCLQEWIDHQVVVVTRRTRYRLDKAEERLHIVDGLVKAVEIIDAIIALIRASKDRPAARQGLMAAPFDFSEIQAGHILDLALGRLTQIGREELIQEKSELEAVIRDLRRILSKRDVLMGVIRDELTTVRDAHSRKRRTLIDAADAGDISVAELVDDEPLVVSVTARGYVQAKSARGRGAKVADPGATDVLTQVVETTALSSLLFFTDRGRAYRVACDDLPKPRLTAFPNLFQFTEGEQVVAVYDTNVAEDFDHLVFATARGTIKRTALQEFIDAASRQTGIAAMKLADDDRVVSVYPSWPEFEALVVTRSGQAIRFPEEEIRTVGRSAAGVRALKLKGDDAVVGAIPVAHEEIVMIVTEAGYAKRVAADEFAIQARGGSGIRAAKIDKRRGALIAVTTATPEFALLSADAAVKFTLRDVRLQTRDAPGSKIAAWPDGTAVARVVPVAELPRFDE